MDATTATRADRATPIPARLWGFAVLAGMASFLDAAGLIATSISLAIWQSHYGLDVWQVGLIGFALQLFLAVGAFGGGWVADRFGRQRVFNADLALLTVGLLVILLAPNGTVLLIGIAIFGICCGADLPVSLAVISDRSPSNARGRLIGWTQVMWALGIVFSSALGFGVSTLGFAGTQILVGAVAVLGAITFVLRLVVARRQPVAPQRTATPAAPGRPDAGVLREVFSRPVIGVLLLVTGFYAFWNIVAGMLAGYTTYFLVEGSGASQTLATGINLALVPIAAVLAIVFVRIADTRWRERIFVIAGALEVLGILVGAVTGGVVLAAVIVMLLIFNLTNPAAGEGLYKVWGQLLFPPRTRAVAQGISFAIARIALALFLLVAPALIASSPAVFLWILLVCMVAAYGCGLVVSRRHVPAVAAAAPGTAQEVRA